MSIGICGYGVVGKALHQWFESQAKEVGIYDPNLGFTNLSALDKKFVFICVPTGTGDYTQDLMHVRSAIAAVPKPSVIVIKSTVLPWTTRMLSQVYAEHTFLFNPEFLEERFAARDMFVPPRQLVGVVDAKDAAIALEVLEMLPEGSEYSGVVPAEVAEMVKYFSNTYYALKITFANQMFDLCTKAGIDYNKVRDIALHDPKIMDKAKKGYLDVPFEGKRGYYGTCLPKDSKALIGWAKTMESPLGLLEQADEYNDRLTKK